MKYHIKTYGCQMNHSDSERIAGVLELAGYEKTARESEANLIVINMCSVRKSAVDRIAGNFKKYKKYKKKNPNFKTVITGCVLESDRKRFEKLFDLVIDIKEIEKLNNKNLPIFKTPQLSLSKGLSSSPDKGRLGGVLDNANSQKTQKGSDLSYFHINPQHQSKITAYVPIMTGCNNFCSYCVVPYTRGREKSRPVEEILDEIRSLTEKGYKEIILLGQNVNSYKSQSCHSALDAESDDTLNSSEQINPNNRSNQADWIPASAGMTKDVEIKKEAGTEKNINFPKLLRLINNIPGNFWIRFLTSHPKDVTEELIKTVAECKKCTEYIHLALQSGDDDILQKMNRKYTTEHFLNLVKIIRKYIPDAAITTDVIVGFPTETEKQFQNTAEVMKKAKFDMVYINKYSPREGTASAKLEDNISWVEKKKREVVLNKILKETALENNKKYVGKTIDILVEKIDDDYIYGKTGSFKNVKINIGYWILDINKNNKQYDITYYHTKNLIGKFVQIKITQADAWGLRGEIVK